MPAPHRLGGGVLWFDASSVHLLLTEHSPLCQVATGMTDLRLSPRSPQFHGEQREAWGLGSTEVALDLGPAFWEEMTPEQGLAQGEARGGNGLAWGGGGVESAPDLLGDCSGEGPGRGKGLHLRCIRSELGAGPGVGCLKPCLRGSLML